MRKLAHPKSLAMPRPLLPTPTPTPIPYLHLYPYPYLHPNMTASTTRHGLKPGWRVAIATALALVALDCKAYIDPNAGGLLFQILLPVIVALVAAWRYLRHRVSMLWQRWTRSDKRGRSDDGNA
jgi:hypothetical protein